MSITKPWFGAAFLAVCAVFSTGIVQAVPISSCTAGVDAFHFTCAVFESNANSAASEISNIISDPGGSAAVSAGYLVILEPGFDPTLLANQQNQAIWSDVVNFIDVGNGSSTSFQFLSRGCNVNPTDISCFPTYSTVFNAPTNDFQSEPPNGILVYNPDFGNPTQNHIYTFNSAPDGVPEPATFGLIGCALIGLALRRKAAVR